MAFLRGEGEDRSGSLLASQEVSLASHFSCHFLKNDMLCVCVCVCVCKPCYQGIFHCSWFCIMSSPFVPRLIINNSISIAAFPVALELTHLWTLRSAGWSNNRSVLVRRLPAKLEKDVCFMFCNVFGTSVLNIGRHLTVIHQCPLCIISVPSQKHQTQQSYHIQYLWK